MNILRHSQANLHTQANSSIIANPNPNMETYADFGSGKIKQERGQLHGFSDWLVKDERSLNSHCHWAVTDEVVGAQKAQKPGGEVFLSTMDTIMVTHSDTSLRAALALGKENRK